MIKLRYPAYYQRFSCIAGQCTDTCCAGWEIDIDDATYAYYQALPGEFGERVRRDIKEYSMDAEDLYESHGFALGKDMRCPFLNQENLCELILHLGEEALCDVCTDTPRNFLEYGGAREISLSISCPEAGRLLFESREPISFVEEDYDDTLSFTEDAGELAVANFIRKARDGAIFILQDRKQGIYERICAFLCYAKTAQEALNHERYEESLLEKAREQAKEAQFCPASSEERFSYFKQRIRFFSELDSVNAEWAKSLERLQALFFDDEGGKRRYIEALQGFRDCLKKKDMEYLLEHLMVYGAFLFLARSVDGMNFWGKAQECAAGFLMVYDMAAERFVRNGEDFFAEDWADLARVYAKETEHSQENLELLEDAFLFEDLYQYNALCRQVLIG